MSDNVFTIVPIVEGHGEYVSVPILLRRLTAKFRPELQVDVQRPIRRARNRIIQPNELERDVELAAEKVLGSGGILILLDADTDCPAELGPTLSKRAREARPDRHIEVVLANPEYETWFLAAATSLRGHRGLSSELSAPDTPENISGAKEWLRRQMKTGATYSETIDQPALTALFDMDAAQSCASFRKLCRSVERLLGPPAEEWSGTY